MARTKSTARKRSSPGPPRETFTLDVDRAVILAEWLSSMTALRILNIESDNLGDEESSALAFSFKEVTLMEKLELSWTEIRNGRADAALGSRNQPQYLQLWNNSIDPDGAALLGDAMGSLTKLQVFGLSGNNIGDNVATEIAPALGKMTQLKELYFRKNNIRSDGASALARAFESMTAWNGGSNRSCACTSRDDATAETGHWFKQHPNPGRCNTCIGPWKIATAERVVLFKQHHWRRGSCCSGTCF